jgi:cyclopropane-fatty-acyl-phospholipid synthase
LPNGFFLLLLKVKTTLSTSPQSHQLIANSRIGAMKNSKEIITDLLDCAGVRINGSRDWDIHILDNRFYDRVVTKGSLGLGEAYMDGWWECKHLDQFFDRVLSVELDHQLKKDTFSLIAHRLNYSLNTGRKSQIFEVAHRHYDLGNALYEAMLDKGLNYSCGYWTNTSNLEQAQQNKLDLVCRKIDLQPGQSVLDIGSGWGGFIGFAGQRYRANALGVTVSVEQKRLADDRYSDTSAVTQLRDYRDINAQFDHVVSIGMFEHVGTKNYRQFMEVAHRSLKKSGYFLLHTIGGTQPTITADHWITKHIFPNGVIPTLTQISQAAEGLFVTEDIQNIGIHYDPTLMAWHHNFTCAWDQIKGNYDWRFYRMWVYYLLSCAGTFRARRNQVYQIVFSKGGKRQDYSPVR